MGWRERLGDLSGTPWPCVLGIGNRLRGDDAVGPLLCDRIDGRFAGEVIDAGVAPENYLERVVASAASLVLVVDGADFGGAAGEVCVVLPEALAGAGVSTHACSPIMLSEYLTGRRADPGPARRAVPLGEPLMVLWVVIQSQSAETGALSPAVAQSVDALAEGLCELWPPKNKS